MLLRMQRSPPRCVIHLSQNLGSGNREIWVQGHPDLQSKFHASQSYTVRPCSNSEKDYNYEPEISFLEIYPWEMKTHNYTKVCAQIVLSTWFITVRDNLNVNCNCLSRVYTCRLFYSDGVWLNNWTTDGTDSTAWFILSPIDLKGKNPCT